MIGYVFQNVFLGHMAYISSTAPSIPLSFPPSLPPSLPTFPLNAELGSVLAVLDARRDVIVTRLPLPPSLPPSLPTFPLDAELGPVLHARRHVDLNLLVHLQGTLDGGREGGRKFVYLNLFVRLQGALRGGREGGRGGERM